MAERSDAVRNRRAILDAARELVGEPGELRLSAVAKRAGVGQGTIYRHFSDRDDLLAQLYDEEVDALVVHAADLLAEHVPDEALRRWFRRLASYAQVKRGVMAAVEDSAWAAVSSRTHGRLGEALADLLGAGADAGVLRGDVDPRDVVLLSWFLAHVEVEEWEARVPRLLDVLLDGLRTRPT